MNKSQTVDLIYADANSLAYKKRGVRYSIMHARGKVLVSELSEAGELTEYMLEIDDAIVALRSAPEADYAVEFIRKLKRKLAVAQIKMSVRLLLKLFGHIILSLIAGSIIGYFFNVWFGGEK